MVTFMAGILMRARSNARNWLVGLSVCGVMFAACGTGESPAEATPALDQGLCADVTEVVATRQASGTFRFEVTVRSADTGWEKYADAWEVRDPSGAVLGTRVLTHPHVDEQPFTRSLKDVVIASGISEVVVVARDSVGGFCGQEVTVDLS